ncbi:MAG: hypothetical protein Q9M32_03040 [Sulfurimonas sp.]|nr:hypothetical protein [Sulfurimonas sp.]MDQ7059673.1 hypothetical protein [Sulfurimonas sp.]
MILVYSKKNGWIGGSKSFFDVFGYKDIHDFRRQHISVRDMFLSESEEIFTEDDSSWLEYIKKHKTKGYELRLYNEKSEIIDALVKCKSI